MSEVAVATATVPAETGNVPAEIGATVDRDAALRAVKYVVKASIPRRPPVPVLAGAMLTTDADAGTLTVAGYDYEVSASETIDADVHVSGAALVSAVMVEQILAKVGKGSRVRFTVKRGRLVIDAGDVAYTVTLLPREDYPVLPTVRGLPFAHLPGAALVDASSVVYAAGRDDTLPMLTCVRLEAKNGTLHAAATDRYRLAVVDTGARARAEHVAMVPVSVFQLVVKEFGKAELVTVHATEDGMVGFRSDNRTLTVRGYDDESFPKYEELFPAYAPNVATMDAGALARANDRASVVAERNTPVRLEMSADGVAVTAGTDDEATARAEVAGAAYAGEYAGGEMVLAFNPAFLGDVVKMLGADVKVVMHASVPGKPAVFTTPDRPGIRVLLMPIRLSG